jgi:hypothetical protein
MIMKKNYLISCPAFLFIILSCFAINGQTVINLTSSGTVSWQNTSGNTVTVTITAKGADGGPSLAHLPKTPKTWAALHSHYFKVNRPVVFF